MALLRAPGELDLILDLSPPGVVAGGAANTAPPLGSCLPTLSQSSGAAAPTLQTETRLRDPVPLSVPRAGNLAGAGGSERRPKLPEMRLRADLSVRGLIAPSWVGSAAGGGVNF